MIKTHVRSFRCTSSSKLTSDVVTPLALTAETYPKVVTVVDSSITTADRTLAVHALSSSSTVFLSGADLHAYLSRLETKEAPLHIVDFATLQTQVETAAAAAPAPAPKENAKIEGAPQIAIGIKKEVDFAAWYTNVCPYVIYDDRSSNILL